MLPVVHNEILSYIGICMFPVTPEWKVVYWIAEYNVAILKVLILCQNKWNSQTNLLDRHEARFAINENIKI